MRARHGNHAVEWDGDFRFGVAPDGAFEVDYVAPARAVGAAFLSGRRGCPVVHVDEDGTRQHFTVSGAMVLPDSGDVENLPPSTPWALCGPGVAHPRIVAAECRRVRAHTVSVCPLLGQLAAFGYVVGALTLRNDVRSRSTRFCEPVTEELDAEYQEFNPDLNGDGLGRMAHLVQARTAVVNQMMETPCIRAFYGRVLSTGRWWGEPVFLMRQETALKYFPTEPLSLRVYAATWVPVAVGNTDEFAGVSGFGGSFVNIFVASELTPGLGSFLRFLEIMGREDFVASSDPKAMLIPEKIPLFRYRRAYNIGADLFKEVALES